LEKIFHNLTFNITGAGSCARFFHGISGEIPAGHGFVILFLVAGFLRKF